jgi:mycothiol synthase
MDNLTWRPVTHDDMPAIADLAKACYRSDGGLGFLFAPQEISGWFFPEGMGAATGAWDADGRLVACSTVTLFIDSGTHRATILGFVHPGMRRKGIGTALMRWSQAQAESLIADTRAEQRVVRIRTESLTDPADRLYRAFGFQSVFDELVMRHDLGQPLPDQPLPEGVTLSTWLPELGDQFYQAYHAAFRERPGFPGWSAKEWIGYVTENDHIPEWSLLAREDEAPLGFVIGNIDLTNEPPGGFIWQVGVVPAARRRGLASALLVETMRRMQASGAPWADLTVHTNNPGAIKTYAEIGFVTVGQRARYERVLE